MKSLTGFLLLLIMLFNLTGISIVFTIHKARIRREMKHQIKQGVPEKDLHALSFYATDMPKIEWIKEGKEFRFKGEMYDVVYSKKKDEYITYYCLNDKEEKNLFAHLDDMVRKKMKDERRTGKNGGKLIRAISSLVYLPADNLFIFNNESSRLRHFSKVNTQLASPYLEYITPPPRLS